MNHIEAKKAGIMNIKIQMIPLLPQIFGRFNFFCCPLYRSSIDNCSILYMSIQILPGRVETTSTSQASRFSVNFLDISVTIQREMTNLKFSFERK